MDDNSNSSRVDNCGDGEEEEDEREKRTHDKSASASRLSKEGTSSNTNPPR